MLHIADFRHLEEDIKRMGKSHTIALVCPHDQHTENVMERALQAGFARFAVTTYGQLASQRLDALIRRYGHEVEVVECDDADDACRKAVALVREGRAEILMKGLVGTDQLLHAALDKQRGILEQGRVMTHLTLAEIPAWPTTQVHTTPRMLLFSDAAVIPCPDIGQLDAIVGYCAEACRRLGVAVPRIALTHCNEKVNAKFPVTLHYEEIKRRAAEGRYADAIVDGPMDVKTACDAESGDIKGIHSPVAGQADAIVFPDIEAGNTFYKTVTLFAHATTAGWLAGTTVPVVLTSRADSELSKYYSLMLACLQA